MSTKEITQSALSELNKIRAYDNDIAEKLSKMIKSSKKKVRLRVYESIQRDPRFNIDPKDDIDVVFRHIADTLRSKSTSGKFGSARGSQGIDSRGRSYSLDGLPMLDADSDKAIYKGSLADLSNSRRANEYSRDGIHDEGTVDVRTGPMTVSNRPLVDRSPLAGPYFCPETPDRVKVDGMYVVSRPDDVRGFYDNGDVMVLRVLGGSSDEDNKPGTARCEILDVYRKAIQRYEDAFRSGSSRGSNLVNWTFYYDNGGKTDEEKRADDDVWAGQGQGSLTTPVGVAKGTGTEPVIVLSRFDGREDFGYVFNQTFFIGTAVGNADKFSETNVMRFFKRESPYNVFMDKIIGDDDAIRFVECNPKTQDPDGKMKEAACERVQRYLKSDQTAVIVLPVDFLYRDGHGFDEKILALTNIVKNLRKNNRSFYDRIAYYFAKSTDDIQFRYNIKTPEFNLNQLYADFQIVGTGTNNIMNIQRGDLNTDDLNICYNGGRKVGPNRADIGSTTACFQIIRGSKATDIKEIYIVKEAPEINQTHAYTDSNDMTNKLMAENVINAARIPYVTENLLSDFVSRREFFPMMTSESAARKFFVRPMEPANPFKTNTNQLSLFDYDQLPEDVLADCKNGTGIIVYPECDGTEGSCVPPQLNALAERLELRLVAAPLKYFTKRNIGIKLIGLRCVKKLTHNNHELYIANCTKGIQLYDDDTFDNTGKTITNDCKITSLDVDIQAFMNFFNNEKIDKSKFVASCQPQPQTGTGNPIFGCVVPLK